MSSEDFARRVVDALLREKPPRVVRAGGGTGVIRIMEWLPDRLRERLFGRMFGLEVLRAGLAAQPAEVPLEGKTRA